MFSATKLHVMHEHQEYGTMASLSFMTWTYKGMANIQCKHTCAMWCCSHSRIWM